MGELEFFGRICMLAAEYSQHYGWMFASLPSFLAFGKNRFQSGAFLFFQASFRRNQDFAVSLRKWGRRNPAWPDRPDADRNHRTYLPV